MILDCGSHPRLTGISSDLSLDGAWLDTTEPILDTLPPGTRVTFTVPGRLNLHGSAPPALTATVVRSAPGGVALRFDSDDTDSRHIMRTLLDTYWRI